MKVSLIVIGVLLILMFLDLYLRADRFPDYIVSSEGVVIDIIRNESFNISDDEINELNSNWDIQEVVYDFRWTDSETLEVDTLIRLVCLCEDISDVDFEAINHDFTITYDSEVLDENKCADCAFLTPVRFRFTNITRYEYDVFLEQKLD